jgi:HAE1 family hydrophobic/amphiphilic exporter-1
MVVSTILNLVFIPVLYVIAKTLLARLGPKPGVLREGCDENVVEVASH